MCYQVPLKIFDELVVDKYDSKNIGSCTNVQAKVGKSYNITRTNVRKGRIWELYVWMK